MFARIALDHFGDKEFDYRIPKHLMDQILPGSRVLVPFGNARKPGTVLSVEQQSAVVDHKIKEIVSVTAENYLLDAPMMELLRWLHRYYGSPLGKVLHCAIPAVVRHRSARSLQKKGIVRMGRRKVPNAPDDAKAFAFTAPKPVLNQDQCHAVGVLCRKAGEGFHCVLLQGVTGSGKTEVYLRLIEHVLQSGRTAMVLVPEISLTPQTIDRFRSRFQEPIAVVHSGLTNSQRMEQWEAIHRGNARIVIGARSAVFAPLTGLGVIIVDEEQERSFKQQETPHYHARDVAVMRAKIEKALVVLGSATPSLESYYNAVRGKYELLELPTRVEERPMPKIEILDMRRETTKNGAIPVLSAKLAALIQTRLDRKEQTMLFLNRRGFHRCLWCPSCAQSLHCPHCSVTMTVHRVGTKLLCHLCGFHRDLLTRCPQCATDLLIPQGYGTQKIETIVRKWFHGARVARMDADTTRRKDSHRDILSRFAMGQYDILIGTQMIAKGHDFPNVTLVGVLNADIGLNIPDFRAGEQTFQLLTQVSGRAGRGIVGGEVIVQTHTPAHYVMAAVKSGDYKSFYEREISQRIELDYPPKVHLMLVTVGHTSEAKAQEWAGTLYVKAREGLKSMATVFNPAPAPIQKSKGRHRWQILIKTSSVVATQDAWGKMLAGLNLPSGIRVDTDVDPQSLA